MLFKIALPLTTQSATIHQQGDALVQVPVHLKASIYLCSNRGNDVVDQHYTSETASVRVGTGKRGEFEAE